MIYIFLVVLLILLSYHYDNMQHKNGRLHWYLLCLCLFVLISGLRYRLGVDTIEYEKQYSLYPSLINYFGFDFENEKYGRGFIFMMAFAKSISSEFFILQLIHAIFVNSVLFYFFYTNTKHIFFSILLYFILYYFTFNFEVLRESSAVCIFILAWKYFCNNKWIKYYIFSGIAILFHPSAAITLVLPLIKFPWINKLFAVNKVFLISLALVFVVSSIIYVRFFDLIRLIELSDVQNYSTLYENNKYGESASINLMGFLNFLIRFIFYPVIAIWFMKHNNSILDNNNNQIKTVESICCMFMYIAVASLFIKILGRFNNYFYPILTIAIADMAYGVLRLKKKKYKLSYSCWVLIFFPYFLFSTYGFFKSDGGTNYPLIRRYYPYSSVIFPERDKDRENLYSLFGR